MELSGGGQGNTTRCLTWRWGKRACARAQRCCSPCTQAVSLLSRLTRDTGAQLACGQLASMAKLMHSWVTQFYAIECCRAPSDLMLNPPLWLQKEYHFLQHLSSLLITHLGIPNLFPPPFLVFTWKGRQHYGKTKHKPEYDAVGKHWDFSIWHQGTWYALRNRVIYTETAQRTPIRYLQLDTGLYSRGKEAFLFPQSLTPE